MLPYCKRNRMMRSFCTMFGLPHSFWVTTNFALKEKVVSYSVCTVLAMKGLNCSVVLDRKTAQNKK